MNTLQQRIFKHLMSGSSSHGELSLHEREHDDRAVRNSLTKTAVQTESENVTTILYVYQQDGPLERDVMYFGR